MRFFLLPAIATATLFLFGCGDSNEEVRVYRVSKPAEETAVSPGAAASTPQSNPAMGGPSVNPSSQMTALPGMTEAAASIATPSWKVPEIWKELPPTPIRKGNFRLDGTEGGVAEVTVTVFPGDVGGLVANVNRWRTQIALPPLSPEAVESVVTSMTISGQEAFVIDLTDEPSAQSIRGAAIPRDGNTWFVKMVGSSELVRSQGPEMDEFLSSIEF